MSQQETKDMAKYFYRASAADFMKIPGGPVAYWVDEELVEAFQTVPPLEDSWLFRQGMATSDNERFLRYWHEVSWNRIDTTCEGPQDLKESSRKWFPYNKGGSYRKWYGNNDLVVNWENDGREMKEFTATLNQGMNVRLKSREYYCLPNITYSALSSGDFGCRVSQPGFLFDTKGSCLFGNEDDIYVVAALLNSSAAKACLQVLCPTLDYNMVGVKKVPYFYSRANDELARRAVDISKWDWDQSEESWGFQSFCLATSQGALSDSLYEHLEIQKDLVEELNEIEERINDNVINEFGFSNDIGRQVSVENISLRCNPDFNYSSQLSEKEKISRHKSELITELVSYSIACILGRFSVDKPGLIIASKGETIQDYLRQIPSPRFTPDDDAILPLTDQEWFADDATNRFREFVRVVWGDEYLQENLDFVAESLCLHAIKPKRGESALDTIRRYLSTQFYKDHLRTYKKRPIYWLFSSGKHKAFECLVYLHRYNEGTLARMRTEYVIPLSAKLNAYAEKLEQDKDASTSAAETKRLEKEIATLHKQQAELAEFDEKLRHYADQRIALDLDDGVKVNYGKFGDLLAEVKAVTGEKPQ